MVRSVTDAGRHQHGTAGAVVFVVGLSRAAAVLLLLSIPLGWAILATVGLAVVSDEEPRA